MSVANTDVETKSLLCPSARPEMNGSVLFGVVTGTVDEHRVAYLKDPNPVGVEVLTLPSEVAPTEIFRFAAPCACSGCVHFNDDKCRLAARLVRLVPNVVDVLPQCKIRPNCRWWIQEGRAACLRCPQIVTEDYGASEKLRDAASP